MSLCHTFSIIPGEMADGKGNTCVDFSPSEPCLIKHVWFGFALATNACQSRLCGVTVAFLENNKAQNAVGDI